MFAKNHLLIGLIYQKRKFLIEKNYLRVEGDLYQSIFTQKSEMLKYKSIQWNNINEINNFDSYK